MVTVNLLSSAKVLYLFCNWFGQITEMEEALGFVPQTNHYF